MSGGGGDGEVTEAAGPAYFLGVGRFARAGTCLGERLDPGARLRRAVANDWIDDVILIFLSIALARRFRDIGWPVWIGPTILLVTIGLPFLGIGIAVMNHAGDQIMQWLPLYGLISGPLNLVLLIVAGFVPGKPARAQNIEVAHVFE